MGHAIRRLWCWCAHCAESMIFVGGCVSSSTLSLALDAFSDGLRCFCFVAALQIHLTVSLRVTFVRAGGASEKGRRD
jgi:hypothetical protein